MADITQLSDDELRQLAAQSQPQNDITKLSDDQLMALAGQQIKPSGIANTQALGQMTPFEQQMSKALYNGLPFGKRIIDSIPGGQQWGQQVNAIPQPQGFAQNAGAIIGGIGAASPAMELGGMALKPLASGFKVYNDAMVSGAVKSAVNKIQSFMQPLREAYKTINTPYANRIVDRDIFQKILGKFPESIQKDLVDDYGTGIVDANGKPMTTNGKLYDLEMNLKSLVKQPKYGQKLQGDNFDTAQLAQEVKKLRLSNLPDDAVNQIKALDTKFAPAIKMEREYLPKMMDENGVPKTDFVYNAFRNPAKAGIRNDMRNLKNLGVDLSPEIKTFEGWVKRQALKSQIKGTADKVAEGAVIGTALRGLGR